jgi:copper homeostasis protein CutC
VLPEDIAAAAELGNEEVVVSWLEGGGHIDAAHPQARCTLLTPAPSLALTPP